MSKREFLQEGDVIELFDGHRVYADVPEHFIYANRKGRFSLAHGLITIGGEFSYFAGRYVVTKTTMDGGGTGHGPHDVYPNGHHVFCENVDDRSRKVDFYQSGSFTAMIQEIKPVGRATLRWFIDDDALR